MVLRVIVLVCLGKVKGFPVSCQHLRFFTRSMKLMEDWDGGEGFLSLLGLLGVIFMFAKTDHLL